MGTEGLGQGPRGLTATCRWRYRDLCAALRATDGGQAGRRASTAAVLNERYDLSVAPPRASRWTAANRSRRRSRQSAGRDDLGAAGGDDPGPDPRPERLRRGSTPCRIPTTPRGLCLSAFPIDAIKRQDGRDLKRFDLISICRITSSRVSSGHVPDTAYRSGRCLAGQAVS
jgi:hypothetical protein